MDGTAREVKKVRKARDRRQEWSVMAYDKELRPDARPAQTVRPGAPSEGSLSPDTRCVRGPRCAPPTPDGPRTRVFGAGVSNAPRARLPSPRSRCVISHVADLGALSGCSGRRVVTLTYISVLITV